MNKQPNIILIFEDHKAFYGHGQMGEHNAPKIKKPNFDKISNEGIVFTNSYTACPLCGPARRTILTGLYPHNHGEIKNETNEEYAHPLYFNHLTNVGYQNYYFGKWHAGKGTALDFNCKGFSVPGYGNPYITPEYNNYLQENKLDFIQAKVTKNFGDPISNHLGLKEGQLYQFKFPVYSQYISSVMTTPKETHEAFFLVNLACKTLREIANHPNKQPFHMRVDFWGPHEPYVAPQEYIDLYNPEEIPKHPNFIDDLNSKPELYKKQNGDLLSRNKQLILPNPLPWQEWQEVLATNYAEQTLIDEAAGILLQTLEELGLTENTVVMWAADHGDAVASHGGHFDKDAYMPQELIRVPLAIRYLDVIKPGRCDELVSNMDYGPTFLEIAGTSFKNAVDGKSLIPLCLQKDAKWRKDLMIETHGHFTTIVGRALLYNRHKYIYNEGYMDELYDLDKDPWELQNLINNKAYKAILEDMKLRLKKWRQRTNDIVSYDMIKGKRLQR